MLSKGPVVGVGSGTERPLVGRTKSRSIVRPRDGSSEEGALCDVCTAIGTGVALLGMSGIALGSSTGGGIAVVGSPCACTATATAAGIANSVGATGVKRP